ncbi:MAG: hypothetical protein FJW30_29155 [Acidobacteria bacterium]|nr:hypothetical protein [Acidobacteriota bacterium]
MTNKNFLLLSLHVAALALPAREEVTREFSKTQPWTAGQTIVIEHRHGDIAIRAVPGTEIRYQAFVRVSAGDRSDAEAFANGITFDVTAASFRTRYPELRTKGFLERLMKPMNMGYSVRLEIQIPEKAPLDVRNAFGGVEVDAAQGGAWIHNDNGGVVLRRTTGTQRIETKFGRVRVDRNTGSVSVTNDNGGVSVFEVNGPVNVKTKFGEAEVGNATGDVDIVNSNGSVKVSDAGGRVTIATSFGGATVARVKGGLTIKNDNGSIEAARIGAEADLSTKFGPIKVNDVAGSLTARNDNGSIDAANVRGTARLTSKFGEIRGTDLAKEVWVLNDNGAIRLFAPGAAVTAQSKFGEIRIERTKGPVEARNDNGAIHISKLGGNGCEALRASTKFASIEVALPDSANYDVSATSRHGQVRSEFPNATRIGRGGCELTLNNDNGSIEIRRRAE